MSVTLTLTPMLLLLLVILADTPSRARNLIGQSQSGTGKTAAFTLNMLSRVDPAIMAPQVGLNAAAHLTRDHESSLLGERRLTFIPRRSAWRRPESWHVRSKTS